MKYLIFLILIIGVNIQVFAQLDSTLLKYQNEFLQFSKSIQKEFVSFQNENDSTFSESLKNSWREFNLMYNAPRIDTSLNVQPKAIFDGPLKHIKIQLKDSIQPSNKEMVDSTSVIQLDSSLNGTNSGSSTMLDFDFYGINEKTIYPNDLPIIHRLDSNSINAYFSLLSKKPCVNNLISDLTGMKNKIHLNDWGYYQIVDSVIGAIDKSYPEDILLKWVILLKSGYEVKIGYNSNSAFLLFPCKEEVFSWFVDIDGVPFYVLSEMFQSEMTDTLVVHTNEYKDNNIMSLQMMQLPLLGNENHVETNFKFFDINTTLEQNSSFVGFLKDYPFCALNIYFNTPLSPDLNKSCKGIMDQYVKGETRIDQVRFILKFVQDAFPYKLDADQFGKEKYLFADQLFHYPYSDCEDKAVLFCRLVSQLTGLDCVGLVYPNHVTTAVCLHEEHTGSYLTIKSKNYVVCDPTYENAPIGYLDKEFHNQIPEVISVNQ